MHFGNKTTNSSIKKENRLRGANITRVNTSLIYRLPAFPFVFYAEVLAVAVVEVTSLGVFRVR